MTPNVEPIMQELEWKAATHVVRVENDQTVIVRHPGVGYNTLPPGTSITIYIYIQHDEVRNQFSQMGQDYPAQFRQNVETAVKALNPNTDGLLICSPSYLQTGNNEIKVFSFVPIAYIPNDMDLTEVCTQSLKYNTDIELDRYM